MAQPFREYMMEEAILQYKDYYESDIEDLEDFEHITREEKIDFVRVYRDYAKISAPEE